MRSKLKSWLSWQPHPTDFMALMQPVKRWPVQMDRYSRGIDNTRIDVNLDPQFAETATTLVRSMVRYDVASRYWSEAEGQPASTDLQKFRNAYRDLVEGAIKRKRLEDLAREDWVCLVQLSLLKFLLQLVPREIQALRRQLKAERDAEQALKSGRQLEHHERLVVLSREENAIVYRVYKRLFNLVDRVESTQLRKVGKSLIGASWSIPREVLFNPLLQLPDLFAEEAVMHHYPMLCIEENGQSYLSGINRCLIEVFTDYLPTWTQAQAAQGTDESESDDGGRFRLMDRLDQGGLRGFLETEIVLSHLLVEEEYKQPLYSWLDDPENLKLLLSEQLAPQLLRSAKHHDGRLTKHWRDFKRAIRDELIRHVEHLDIGQRIAASYWTPRIYQELSGHVPARLIYEYLIGKQPKRKMLQRLTVSQMEMHPARAAKTLEFAAGEIRQLSRAKRHQFIQRVLVDFLGLRRDLKLAFKTFEAMDQIRLHTDEDDINLSRANDLLYEFKLADEQTSEGRILHHVILKADVRGSSRITSELRAKKLNPATHFSQNLFNPINRLITDFGANKVFIEGDAVILSFLEYTNDTSSRLSVAHACGMGGQILELVNRQNIFNRRHGLPELELGLGIVFCDEPPTFLYDGDRQIMISPAINLADRLSSCARLLRSDEFAGGFKPFRVEVLLPAESAALPVASKADVVRYNVNGIELDQAAFNKLKHELVLQHMDLKVAGRAMRFHVGRYPDRSGRIQWLVVRESNMRLWKAGRILRNEARNRRFYEVLVEPSLVNRIRSMLRPGRDEKEAVTGEALGVE